MNKISGNIVDVVNKLIYKGEIYFTDKIEKIIKTNKVDNQYILPGLINSHVHIESSMLSPMEFSNQVVKHGTVAVITDPHEITNILGINGINYMIENSKNAPIKIFYGAPSCVPATTFESSGASLNSKQIDVLFKKNKVHFLSEMMNFPGVIYNDKEVHNKLKVAQKYNKPIDGHAPGLVGKDLEKYVNSGVSTDHECFNLNEALEKIKYGMKVQIREGSAAKNFDSLYSLIDSHNEMVMICTDDSHPDDLINGHINSIIQKAFNKNLNYFNVLRTCTLNPIKHYNIPVGLLQQGDFADFVICKNKHYNEIDSVFINGINKTKNISLNKKGASPNNFNANKISLSDIKLNINGNYCNVISVIEGELITKKERIKCSEIFDNNNLKNTYNKIIVLNRYNNNAKPAIGIIKNFNIINGAIASTISHDSHNLICIGKNDTDIVNAINLLVKSKGGISACFNSEKLILPLEIGGIMTNKPALEVAKKYKEISDFSKFILGSTLKAPFMTMSFMSLLVIPELKISDKGLFDIKKLKFVELFEN